ncbi:uncharacterized protein Z520_09663 [Fonsecaea multimorphosa CBS 102226]|uniref:Uncharacterized protein n=1 Tax=Fonsecaea multimorphosa CBS 102226 TaxID=1442371 RepID=A0A0D2JMS1_9EURO|nr:uncharacterized protein Z520_09663 [Fonsecaea multimorphosa CBS 102226]KIX94617.1 hypothetical protein Z520_09663 [Fonsecaea multimorphosa CBS 102226]OAL20325.1 hypothetical protein AYO22_09037 [Fonsecaea multimorphosa]
MPVVMPTPAEIAEAETVLDKEFKEFKKAMETARRQKKIANRLKKLRLRLKDLTIPAKVYKAGVIKNQEHKLTNLPHEVRAMIFKALPLNADRASLALTCKTQAASYEQLRAERNKKDYDHHVPKRSLRIHRLQMLVRVRETMSPKHRLCYTCLQFIDTHHADNKGTWGGDPMQVQGLKADKAAMVEGPRCPLCVAAEKLETAKHKVTYKKYLALADSCSLKK